MKKMILFINDTQVCLGLRLMVLPVESALLVITSAKRMELKSKFDTQIAHPS